jgi:PQQ-dependent catabolism-associated beta-propeller protein
MAHFIDTESHEIVGNVLVDSRPRFAEFTADSSQVWVSAEVGGTVSIIDTNTRQIIHKVTFAIPNVTKETIQPVGIRITKDRKYAFVALGPANRVAVINAQTFEVEKYLLVGQRVWQLAFTPDQNLLFSANGLSNDVSAIDVKELRVIRSIPVGRLPWGVVVVPN